MRRAATLLLLSTLAAAACSSAPSATRSAATPATAPRPTRTPNALTVDHPTVWLCRPGLPANPCQGGLDATDVSPTGTRTRTAFRPAVTAPVDCFYVYPTVSEATTVSAPLRVTPAEVRTVRAQAARFSSVCEVFAPVYRQVTVHALVTGHFGDPAPQALAYADVVSAWHDYLRLRPSRRFVLIGHSQGSFQLLKLLQGEIDADPLLRARLVSALLLGGNVKVPHGKLVGGDLQNIPLCTAPRQHGCVVTYNTFDTRPPADSLFGRPDTARGLVGACTNPAALSGGPGPLLPYLPTPHLAPGSRSVPGTESYATGFVGYPGYLTAQCHEKDGEGWLQVSAVRRPADVRPVLPTTLGPAWGLHLIDVNVALGTLVDLVRTQST